MCPLLAALAVTAAACDETIEPPDPIDQRFTLWGAFDPTGDVQAIRVVPIALSLGIAPPPLPDVTVRSTDVDTGAETVWRDSLVSYADGSVGRLAVAGFRPAFGSRHRLRVTPREGAELRVDVPVPPATAPVRQPSGLPPGDVRYVVDWPGAPQLNAVRLEYTVIEPGCATRTYTFPFPGQIEETADGWRLTMLLDDDSVRLRNKYPRPSPREPPPRLGLTALRVVAEVASSTWRGVPDDPVLLVQPEAFTNVENGYGFVGSAYESSLRWSPPSEEVRRTQMFYHPSMGACG